MYLVSKYLKSSPDMRHSIVARVPSIMQREVWHAATVAWDVCRSGEFEHSAAACSRLPTWGTWAGWVFFRMRMTSLTASEIAFSGDPSCISTLPASTMASAPPIACMQ